MIWDCIIFGLEHELDMLECRLTELQDVPNLRHVIVEAEVDFQGRPKPMYFASSKVRFRPWLDRITWVHARTVATLTGDERVSIWGPAWDRIVTQRDWTINGLRDAEPGDWLLVGDVDEIPSVDALQRALVQGGHLAFSQRMSASALEWIYPEPHQGTVLAPIASAADGIEHLREQRNVFPRLADGGWHLSWLGAPEDQVRKVRSYAHTEYAELADAIRSGHYVRNGWHIDGTKLIARDFEELEWPRWIAQRQCPPSWFR